MSSTVSVSDVPRFPPESGRKSFLDRPQTNCCDTRKWCCGGSKHLGQCSSLRSSAATVGTSQRSVSQYGPNFPRHEAHASNGVTNVADTAAWVANTRAKKGRDVYGNISDFPLSHDATASGEVPVDYGGESGAPPADIYIKHPYEVMSRFREEEEFIPATGIPPVGTAAWWTYVQQVWSGPQTRILHTVHFPPGMEPSAEAVRDGKIIAVRRLLYTPGCIPQSALEPVGPGETQFPACLDIAPPPADQPEMINLVHVGGAPDVSPPRFDYPIHLSDPAALTTTEALPADVDTWQYERTILPEGWQHVETIPGSPPLKPAAPPSVHAPQRAVASPARLGVPLTSVADLTTTVGSSSSPVTGGAFASSLESSFTRSEHAPTVHSTIPAVQLGRPAAPHASD